MSTKLKSKPSETLTLLARFLERQGKKQASEVTSCEIDYEWVLAFNPTRVKHRICPEGCLEDLELFPFEFAFWQRGFLTGSLSPGRQRAGGRLTKFVPPEAELALQTALQRVMEGDDA